jgi:hypothetical protein
MVGMRVQRPETSRAKGDLIRRCIGRRAATWAARRFGLRPKAQKHKSGVKSAILAELSSQFANDISFKYKYSQRTYSLTVRR